MPLSRWRPFLDRHFPPPYGLRAVAFRFRDPETERRFFDDYQLEPVRFSSLAIGSGLVLYILFGGLDWILFPRDAVGTIWLIRFGITSPLIALGFGLTLAPAVQRYLDPIQFTVVQVVGISVVAIMYVAPQPERWLYMAGMGVLLVYNFNFLRMRFWTAVASGFLPLAWLLGGELLGAETPPEIVGAYVFLFVTISIPAMAGAFISELYARRAFVQTRLIEEVAYTDELTGLPNRRHLMERLLSEVRRSRRYGRPVSLAMVDVDHFKQVNDEHGHVAGDRALKAIATHLDEAVRAPDFLGRFGGEEFAVILPEAGIEGARAVGERIRRRIGHARIPVSGRKSVSVSVSVGVASLRSDQAEVNRLLRLADHAMYQAKARGRDQVASASASETGE